MSEDKQVQFQLNEGQKVRGVKAGVKSFFTSEKNALMWEELGIGVIVVAPDPFANSILSDSKPEEVTTVKKVEPDSLVDDLFKDSKPKKITKKAGKK
tara:strand:- start:575 stop:865 length:291 start_codon:yes stop_codon:yes gene_type:complete